MENFETMLNSKNKSVRTFANTILLFRNSQGFYARLYFSICEQDKEQLQELIKILERQNFNDSLDVVMWLES